MWKARWGNRPRERGRRAGCGLWLPALSVPGRHAHRAQLMSERIVEERTGAVISREAVEAISARTGEPAWMREQRLGPWGGNGPCPRPAPPRPGCRPAQPGRRLRRQPGEDGHRVETGGAGQPVGDAGAVLRRRYAALRFPYAAGAPGAAHPEPPAVQGCGEGPRTHGLRRPDPRPPRRAEDPRLSA